MPQTSDDLYHDDRPEGRCGECRADVTLMQCVACGVKGYILDCGHLNQPRPIAAGRSDGSELWHTFCADCAEVED